jgi:hypothetical protein
LGHGSGGSHELTRVNLWIKMVIIIVLKPHSGIDPRQGLDHELGGSTWLTHFFKKNN